MPKKITLRRFDDLHCHLRLNPLLSQVLPYTARYAGRAIVMPNTRPRAILTAEDVFWYRTEIENALDLMPQRPDFQPLMTIEIRDSTTPKIIKEAHKAGAAAGKVYPLGVTTNSDEGMRNPFSRSVHETFLAMQDLGMPLLLHGEIDKERVLVTRREEEFLPILLKLMNRFRKLKIVLEHISTKRAANLVRDLGENVAATITAHHLCLTLNDVIGHGLQPHNACMPTPKDFEDRDALLEAAVSGNAKFFLGSDSAPHPKKKKECARGACGVFSAPILPCLLAGIFEKEGKLDRLEDFTSRFGAKFYGLPLNQGKITLIEKIWKVPEHCGSVIPFLAGQELSWQMSP